MTDRLRFCATAARGTEELLAQELTELGAQSVRQHPGLLRFVSDWEAGLRIALWTRIAVRVLYPLGEFKAVGADGLYQATESVPWEEHLTTSSSFAVDAVVRDSEHSHSGFVALKIKDAVVDRLRKKLGSRPNIDVRQPDVRIVAHLNGQRLSLALDVGGGPLHQRGYRAQPTLAPLKETLAAAMLRAARYLGEETMLDPMCGSGTLVIEAGLIATRRPPGLARSFGVERWPHLGTKASRILRELKSEARAQERRPPFPIRGMDRDADALRAARANLKAARFSSELQLSIGDAMEPLKVADLTPGLLIANPPYGNRLRTGGQKGMKGFYFKLGENLRQLKGWRLFILSGNPAFESAFHLKPSSTRPLWNGPLKCQLLGYSIE